MLRASKRSSPSGLASSASSSVWSGLDICARGSPIHSVGDGAAAHKIDARDLNDRVIGRIGAGGFDVDNA
jgi:hypothetical protein